jgi:putative RecB family exonuclease
MSLQLPASLSPSKLSSFTSCALAFRFANIDRLPEPPSAAATRGTLVHRALELLHWSEPAGQRSLTAGLGYLDQAWTEMQTNPDFTGLALVPEQADAFRAEAEILVRNYFTLEDPNAVEAIGLELMLSVEMGGTRLRGIIDRLDLHEDGSIVVTDYKTGRAPSTQYEGKQLGGVAFYAYLCEEALGKRPARVQLLHLKEPVAIISEPTDQSIRGMQRRAGAVWSAVTQACVAETFRPRPSALCNFCAFHAYCPAQGGNIELVAGVVAERRAEREAAKAAAVGIDPLPGLVATSVPA